MQETIKKQLVEAVKKHITSLQERIIEAVQNKEARTDRMTKETIKMSPGDALVQRKLLAHNLEQIENLRQLYPSPYFTKCVFVVDGKQKTLYFSKFSFSEENIYSWITPAATLRFENPGQASYVRPDGSVKFGILESKDQYMIVDGQLLFYATESIEHPRELVHQEHFTRYKEGFILPEVVEQMEKAQDQVVRAHYQGPFVISGPAGSGKTTLALHRIAYLSQSPETTEYFQSDSVMVLVQDTGTKDYFCHLLPSLGIRGVAIQTFAEWAAQILGLKDFVYSAKYSSNKNEQFMYEYSKMGALKNNPFEYSKNAYSYLEKMYEKHFTPELKKLWRKQRTEKVLDRFDLTLLLQAYYKTKGSFAVEKEYYEELANGSYRKKKNIFPIKYNLLVVDEFQNYLPEQLSILQSCMNARLNAMVYVGDLAQQTQLGTIRDLTEIGETIKPDRLVVLQKVYRNTQEILEYIRNIGFTITIPKEIKKGKAVLEKSIADVQSGMVYIKEMSKMAQEGETVGILAYTASYLAPFKETFQSSGNVKCLSFQEAQGVEFNKVFIVGIEEKMFDVQAVPEEMQLEIKKIQKDLLYVGLTRAMSELFILGRCSLKEAVGNIFT